MMANFGNSTNFRSSFHAPPIWTLSGHIQHLIAGMVPIDEALHSGGNVARALTLRNTHDNILTNWCLVRISQSRQHQDHCIKIRSTWEREGQKSGWGISRASSGKGKESDRLAQLSHFKALYRKSYHVDSFILIWVQKYASYSGTRVEHMFP